MACIKIVILCKILLYLDNNIRRSGFNMKRISRIAFTIAALIIGFSFTGIAQAQDSGSSGPVFLNKIKNIFSSDSNSNTKVAPLTPNKRTNNSRQNTSRNNTSSQQGMTLGEQRRQAWMARRQNTRQIMEQIRTEINQDIKNNYMAAQQFQANLQANGREQNPSNSVAPSGAPNAASSQGNGVASGGNTRIIVPQNNEDSSGSKPVFKNYR